MKLNNIPKTFIIFTLFTLVCSTSPAQNNNDNQGVEAKAFVAVTSGQREKINERELIARYPVGKKWASSKSFRVQGEAVCKTILIEGEQWIHFIDRYQTVTEVVSNGLGEIRLKILVADISQTRIAARERLRLADFSSNSPVENWLINEAGEMLEEVPGVGAVIKIAKRLNHVDPSLENTLTKFATATGFELNPLLQMKEFEIVRNAKPLAGCTFEVIWANGLGISSVRQLAGPVDVELKDIERWAATVDPLFDYYIMDTFSRKTGDRWEVKADNVVHLLAGQGARASSGSVSLEYLKDSDFVGQHCKHLAILNGNLRLEMELNNKDATGEATDIQGKILFAHDNYLVLAASGTCSLKANVKSDTHLLFGVEWQRNVAADFRYEARVIGNGN